MSLLDVTTEATEATETTEQEQQPESHQQEEGQQEQEQQPERPEWLPEGFETPEELAEAYNGRPMAPEAYELNKEGYEGFAFDDASLDSFMTLSKEMNIPQESFDKFVGLYVETEQNRAALDIKARQDHAISSFGGEKQFKEAVGNLTSMAKAQLSEDQFQLLSVATSASQESGAAVMQLVTQLLSKRETTPLNNRTVTTSNTKSRGELEDMMRDPKYKTDPDFRNQVTAGFKALNGE